MLKASSLFKIAFIPSSLNSKSSLLSISSFINSPNERVVSNVPEAIAKAVLNDAIPPAKAPTPPPIGPPTNPVLAPKPAPAAIVAAPAPIDAGLSNCVIVCAPICRIAVGFFTIPSKNPVNLLSAWS